MTYPRMTCAFCDRPTVPAAFIGNMAVGPKCARRAGLLGSKAPRGVHMATPLKTKATYPMTLELFPELETEAGATND